MGILNVTPDSFSDGGRFLDPERAVEHGLLMLDSGADIVDIGGESSRPGSERIDSAEELDRVLPVVEGLRRETDVLISVDTYRSEVAEQVLKAGADMINDISAFRFDKRLPELVAGWNAGVILMHMRGEPSFMHRLPASPDILGEVEHDLQVAVNKAYKSQMPHDRIIIDPGIGFGKDTAENLKLLDQLPRLGSTGLPVLVGPSRKRFIGDLLDAPVEDRLFGTLACVVVSILRGAHILRVHDVGPAKQVVTIADAVLRGES
jgi:dihydropteroate synthase